MSEQMELFMDDGDKVHKRVEPAFRLDDPRFVWVPSGQTDVTRIWRKYGWTPPSEGRKPQE